MERSRDVSVRSLGQSQDETQISEALEHRVVPALQEALPREEKDGYDAWKEMCSCGSQLYYLMPRHTLQVCLLRLVFRLLYRFVIFQGRMG